MGKWAWVFLFFFCGETAIFAQNTIPGSQSNSTSAGPAVINNYHYNNVSPERVMELERERQKENTINAAIGACSSIPKWSKINQCPNKFQLCFNYLSCDDPKLQIPTQPELKKLKISDDDDVSDEDAENYKETMAKNKDENEKAIKKYVSDLQNTGVCKDMNMDLIAAKFSSQLKSAKEDIKTLTPEVETLKKDLRTKLEASQNEENRLTEKLAALAENKSKVASEYQNLVVETNAQIAQLLNDLKAEDARLKLTVQKIHDVNMKAVEDEYFRAVNAVDQACSDESDKIILAAAEKRRMQTQTGQNRSATISDAITSAFKGGAEGEDQESFSRLTLKCQNRKKAKDQKASLYREEQLKLRDLQNQIDAAVVNSSAIMAKINTSIGADKSRLQGADSKYKSQLNSLAIQETNLNNQLKAARATAKKQIDEIAEDLKKKKNDLLLSEDSKNVAQTVIDEVGPAPEGSGAANSKANTFNENKTKVNAALGYGPSPGLPCDDNGNVINPSDPNNRPNSPQKDALPVSTKSKK